MTPSANNFKRKNQIIFFILIYDCHDTINHIRYDTFGNLNIKN